MTKTQTKFVPTDDMKVAARNLFVAMAVVTAIRPVVVDYQRAILAEGQWRIRPKYAGKLGERVILDPKEAFLMSDENFAIYDAACNRARGLAGLYVAGAEFCPLLVAEHEVVKAEQRLIDAMRPVTHITHDKLMCSGLDKYREYVDLTLRLLAPFVDGDDARRFVRCEESNLPMLRSLGAHCGTYDHVKGGVLTLLSSDALEKIALYPADFPMAPVVSSVETKGDPSQVAQKGQFVSDSPSP